MLTSHGQSARRQSIGGRKKKRQLTFLFIYLLASSVRSITSQHLLILANPDTLSLHDLQVLQTAQNLMVDLEGNLDTECGAFLDGEGLVFQSFEGTGGGEIDDDVRTVFHLESERFDNTAIVAVLSYRVARVQAQGGFPAVQGFVALVCGRDQWSDCFQVCCFRVETAVTVCTKQGMTSAIHCIALLIRGH